jgi:hypothetical protein
MHFVKHPHLHPSQKTPPPITVEPLPHQLKRWLALANMLLIWCGGLVGPSRCSATGTVE